MIVIVITITLIQNMPKLDAKALAARFQASRAWRSVGSPGGFLVQGFGVWGLGIFRKSHNEAA